jgi:chromosome partitioning protein
MKVVAVSNQKGGVSKTTSSLNLSAALAELGSRVLLVDLDPHAGLSICLGNMPASLLEKPTIFEVLSGVNLLSEVIMQTKIKGVDLVPSKMDLSAFEQGLTQDEGWHLLLTKALKTVSERYDYAILDCPPTLNKLITNALAAAHLVIVPIQTDYLAMLGAGEVVEIIQEIREGTNPTLDIRILRTMHDRRTAHSKEVYWESATAFEGFIFEAVIPYSVKFKDATVSGESILSLDPSHHGSHAFRQLARELTEYFNNHA